MKISWRDTYVPSPFGYQAAATKGPQKLKESLQKSHAKRKKAKVFCQSEENQSPKMTFHTVLTFHIVLTNYRRDYSLGSNKGQDHIQPALSNQAYILPST